VGRACGTHGRGKCTWFGWESQKERNHLGDKGVDGIKMNLRDIDLGVWIGFFWLRIGTGGELL
jgi:hypothetical protein